MPESSLLAISPVSISKEITLAVLVKANTYFPLGEMAEHRISSLMASMESKNFKLDKKYFSRRMKN